MVAALTAGTMALPHFKRLRPHYWIGFTVAGLSLVHAGSAMASGPTPIGAGWTAGIWVAMGALLLVVAQVSIGAGLRTAQGEERRRRRRLHLATMALLVTAGLVHVVLNGQLIHALLARAGAS